MHVETLIELHNFNYFRSEASKNLKLPAQQFGLISYSQWPLNLCT